MFVSNHTFLFYFDLLVSKDYQWEDQVEDIEIPDGMRRVTTVIVIVAPGILI